MSRRSDHTREQQIEMAINAGFSLIAEQGFSQFSARKVAKEIGYTVGTIYNIFPSHSDLVLQVNARTLDLLQQKISFTAAEIILSDSTQNTIGAVNSSSILPVDAVKKLAGTYLDFAINYYNNWQAIFEYSLPKDEEVPDWYTDKIHALFDIVKTPLLQITNDEQTAKRHAKIIWACIHGVSLLAFSGKLGVVQLTDSGKDLCNVMIENYIKGLLS